MPLVGAELAAFLQEAHLAHFATTGSGWHAAGQAGLGPPCGWCVLVHDAARGTSHRS